MWCVTPVYARGIGSGVTRVKLVDWGRSRQFGKARRDFVIEPAGLFLTAEWSDFTIETTRVVFLLEGGKLFHIEIIENIDHRDNLSRRTGGHKIGGMVGVLLCFLANVTR